MVAGMKELRKKRARMKKNKSGDVKQLVNLLNTVKDNKEELEWLLQKQDQLRIEYLTFFKKDFKEISANIKGLNNLGDGFSNRLIESSVNIFRQNIEQSLSIVDSNYYFSIKETILSNLFECVTENRNKIEKMVNSIKKRNFDLDSVLGCIEDMNKKIISIQWKEGVENERYKALNLLNKVILHIKDEDKILDIYIKEFNDWVIGIKNANPTNTMLVDLEELVNKLKIFLGMV
jgi:hypothetical protein